jgi:hypothetical protein
LGQRSRTCYLGPRLNSATKHGLASTCLHSGFGMFCRFCLFCPGSVVKSGDGHIKKEAVLHFVKSVIMSTNRPIPQEYLRYKDKVTIVTGGSKGIGEGCVRVFGKFELGCSLWSANLDIIIGAGVISTVHFHGAVYRRTNLFLRTRQCPQVRF